MKNEHSTSILEDIITNFPAKYLQGDERISGKIEGLLLFNYELDRLEFVITPSKDRTIVISYPINKLKRIEIIPMGISKKRHLKMVFDEEKGICPTFRVKDDKINDFIEKVTEFRENALYKPNKTLRDGTEASSDPISNMVSFFSGFFKGAVKTVTKTFDQSKKVLLNIFNPKSTPIPLDYEMTNINGIKHVYLDSKEKIAPQHPHVTVLAIHPIGGAMNVMEPILSRLDIRQYRILAYELRGHGMTIGDQGNFSLQDYVDDLKKFLDTKLKISPTQNKNADLSTMQQLVFVTHSLSSAIVLEYLLRHRQKKEKFSNNISYHLILLSSGHAIPEKLRKGINKLPPIQLWRPFKRIIISKAKEYLVHPKNQSISEEFLIQSVNVPDKVYYEVFKTFLPNYNYKKEEWIRSHENLHSLYILRGDHDLLFSKELFEKTNDFFTRIAKNVDILYQSQVIETAGHLLPLEQPEKVAASIDNFVKMRILSDN